MIEEWLASLGAEIRTPICSPEAYGRGHAKWLGLNLRYDFGSIEIGWRDTFDRWANSTDWIATEINSSDDLRNILTQAQARGEAGDIPSARLTSRPAETLRGTL